MNDYFKLVAYVGGVCSCFSGLVLYGHELKSDGSIIAGAVLIVVGVILLLFSYTNDGGGF